MTLPEEVINIFQNPEAVKIIATTDGNGNPHAVIEDSLTVLDDGSIAYSEALESSRTNRNMTRAIWFNRHIAITIADKNNSYQISGLPVKCLIDGPIFKQFYIAARERFGPDSDIQAVWIIAPIEISNQSPAIRKNEEEEKHPMFKHLDRRYFH